MSDSVMEKKRIQSLDLVKVVAMLMVLMLHVNVLKQWSSTGIDDAFYVLPGIAIPLFFMTSGYLMADKKVSREYILRKIWGIIRFSFIISVIVYGVRSAFHDDVAFPFPFCFLQLYDLGVFWYFGAMRLVYAFLPRAFCDETLSVARMTHRTFFSYVTIQCTEAVILGALCFVGMLIFRFPYALVISVIMVFCALIPIYGAIFSCVIGALLVLIENPMQAIGFVVFILVLQQIETNLIYPRVVSTSINLPPMWVLLAVTVGGGLFGIPGMLIAVPITSICYTLLGQKTHRRLAVRGIFEEELEAPPK